MKVTAPQILICVLMIVLMNAMFAQSTGTAAAAGSLDETEVNGGTATLYSADPISQTLCFGTGLPGRIFQSHQVRNHCSDIEFGNYNPGSFTLGVEGARVAAIVDLGTALDLAHRYGFQETTGYGQGFASLRFDNGKVLVLKNYEANSTQELKESAALFAEGKPGANTPVQQGHIYLARITDRNDKQFQRMVKFIVIGYTPDQSVTIRWQLL
jgi:hypothetical protein